MLNRLQWHPKPCPHTVTLSLYIGRYPDMAPMYQPDVIKSQYASEVSPSKETSKTLIMP